MMIPTELQEMIRAMFPEADLALANDEHGWAEIEVRYGDQHMVMVVADSPEGWERTERAVVAWLHALGEPAERSDG